MPMTSDPQELEKLLRQVTAQPGAGPGEAVDAVTPLDGEAAEWRDAWSGFCRTLAASDAAWAPGPLLADLERRERAARRRVVWSLTLALSWTVLVLGACGWLERLTRSGTGRGREIATATVPGHSGGVPRSTPTAENRTASGSVTDLPGAWNDELDDQLRAARESLVSLRSDWTGGDDLSALSQRLEELRGEWEEGSL